MKLGVSKETGKRCALKYVDKSLVKNKPELLKNEVDILLKVNHRNIIGMIDLFDSKKYMILVMELYVGNLDDGHLKKDSQMWWQGSRRWIVW